MSTDTSSESGTPTSQILSRSWYVSWGSEAQSPHQQSGVIGVWDNAPRVGLTSALAVPPSCPAGTQVAGVLAPAECRTRGAPPAGPRPGRLAVSEHWPLASLLSLGPAGSHVMCSEHMPHGLHSVRPPSSKGDVGRPAGRNAGRETHCRAGPETAPLPPGPGPHWCGAVARSRPWLRCGLCPWLCGYSVPQWSWLLRVHLTALAWVHSRGRPGRAQTTSGPTFPPFCPQW